MTIIGATGKKTEFGIPIYLAKHDDGTYIEGNIEGIVAGKVTGRNKRKGFEKRYPGVAYKKRRGVYSATLTINKNRIYLGEFKTEKEATNARKEAEKRFFNK